MKKGFQIFSFKNILRFPPLLIADLPGLPHIDLGLGTPPAGGKPGRLPRPWQHPQNRGSFHFSLPGPDSAGDSPAKSVH